ncbi:hypothetical protein SAMN04487968_102102 [Nocardioides terrae]|uniref:Hpr(Ser) kinase/phosphatase n=1 Tax=Nocardioides terrae TaxID=574651 RepID=A0A1I1EKJ0_9ACTN|nr:hypothetical protein [Nocardioides terrae]SFB87156.1 hypothetical protein SAMN04487968_102102 [Nocardioides terrae]
MPPGWTPPDWESRHIDLLALGVPVRLRCWGDEPDEVAKHVRRAWAAAIAIAPAAPSVVLDVVVTADEQVRTTASAAGAIADPSIEIVLHILSGRVTLAAIDQQAGRLWMLHGAALADPVTGASVALVAPSGTGKSTAARTLGRRFGYLTDETTGIGADLTIHPHAKPLSIVRSGTFVKEQVGPAEVDLLPGHATPALRAILLLRRDGTRTVGVERLRTSMAIAGLAPETSYLGRLPRPLSFVAGVIERTAGVFDVHYDEAADLEPVVADLVSR